MHERTGANEWGQGKRMGSGLAFRHELKARSGSGLAFRHALSKSLFMKALSPDKGRVRVQMSDLTLDICDPGYVGYTTTPSNPA